MGILMGMLMGILMGILMVILMMDSMGWPYDSSDCLLFTELWLAFSRGSLGVEERIIEESRGQHSYLAQTSYIF